MELGTVQSLWRYRVKSRLAKNATLLRSRCSGRQAYALCDAQGKFASGKNPRRFRHIDGLFYLSAKTVGDEVVVAFPDGTALTEKSSSINNQLSDILGQPLTLTKEAEISHFDDGSIHLLTRASLSLLAERVPHCGIDARRFRPNIVIDSPLLDEDLAGKTLKIGTAVPRISHKTQRCRMITLDQPALEMRPEMLKTLAETFALDFGSYAAVLSTGSISIGDTVEFIAG
jgi:uncharacterized protein YcbX